MIETPKSERPHIALFGRRNSGKSTLINALTGQQIAAVSDKAGTTTDPVYKAMELLPFGPVVFVDTAGLDDEGAIGQLRISKTLEVMRKTDLAILVIDNFFGFAQEEEKIFKKLEALEIPIIIVVNKIDQESLVNSSMHNKELRPLEKVTKVSGATGAGIEELKKLVVKHLTSEAEERYLIKDLIKENDKVILVTPIDVAAPKGRIILPQVQVLREVLDARAIGLVTQVEQLKNTLNSIKENPAMVVTDSQAFKEVVQAIPEGIYLTSFSVLMARYKGEITAFLEGIEAVKRLQPGDKVLIAEACTHQRQHEDIGTIKIPKLLQHKVGGELRFSWVRGGEFPTELSAYKVVIHCGGCMLTQRDVQNRIVLSKNQGIPVVNYGMLLAHLNNILERSLKPLKGERNDYF